MDLEKKESELAGRAVTNVDGLQSWIPSGAGNTADLYMLEGMWLENQQEEGKKIERTKWYHLQRKVRDTQNKS